MIAKVITEIDLLNESKHTRYFKFLLPPAHKDGYRQVTSFNAFFNSERRKNYRTAPPTFRETHLYHQQDDAIGHIAELVTNVPIVEVLDIFDFYRLIGFDYKNRTWLPRPEDEHGPHVRQELSEDP